MAKGHTMSVFSLPEPEIGICDCGQQAHIAYKGKGETLEKVIICDECRAYFAAGFNVVIEPCSQPS